MEKKRTIGFDLYLRFEYDSEELDKLCKQYNIGINHLHKLIEGGMEDFAQEFNLVNTLEKFSKIREMCEKEKKIEPDYNNDEETEDSEEQEETEEEEEEEIKPVIKKKTLISNQTPAKKEIAKKESKKIEDVAKQMNKEFEDLDDLDDLDDDEDD